MSKQSSALTLTLTAALAAAFAAPGAQAAVQSQTLASGYQLAQNDAGGKQAEMACGAKHGQEGACGGKTPSTTKAQAKKLDGKCGEGKCGAQMKSGKIKDGKCGGKMKDGKCGSNKS